MKRFVFVATFLASFVIYVSIKVWLNNVGDRAYWPWGLRRAEFLFVDWLSQLIGIAGLIQVGIIIARHYSIIISDIYCWWTTAIIIVLGVVNVLFILHYC